MPLPLIPVVAGLAALGAGGYGVKKALDAKENMELARQIVERAKKRHETAVEALERSREFTNTRIQGLGRLKVRIFSSQIARLVEEIKKRKSASSTLSGFEEEIEELNLPEMEKNVESSLKLVGAAAGGAAMGAACGALLAAGAYGSVGLLGTASTGTAITALHGVAASNATLAWLGGGALSAGGLGVAGGTAVLGGIVLAPALLITGLWMDSKAQEAKSEAYEYEAKVEKAVAEIEKMQSELAALRDNVQETEEVLGALASAFDVAHGQMQSDESPERFQRLLAIGKTLKLALDTPIMKSDGSAVDAKELKATFSGFLQCC